MLLEYYVSTILRRHRASLDLKYCLTNGVIALQITSKRKAIEKRLFYEQSSRFSLLFFELSQPIWVGSSTFIHSKPFIYR